MLGLRRSKLTLCHAGTFVVYLAFLVFGVKLYADLSNSETSRRLGVDFLPTFLAPISEREESSLPLPIRGRGVTAPRIERGPDGVIYKADFDGMLDFIIIFIYKYCLLCSF